ncbi:MAG: hypothetical protein WC510_05525 [Candidatus Omnitrophota bacterium]
MSINKRSVTLLELVISIVLLSIVVLVFSGFELLVNSILLNSDRKARIQNEVSYIMEHMDKEITKTIGDNSNVPVSTAGISSDNAVEFYVDLSATNATGDGQRATEGDCWRAYRLNSNELWFCPNCTDNATCTTCSPAWGSSENILSKKITAFTVGSYNSSNNYVDITALTGCWDPAQTKSTCGNTDNPSITLRTRIRLPAVSTN